MLAKKPLTDRAIAALKPAAKGKRKLHWDETVPGFAVRVTDSGNKSFVLVTRFAGSHHPTPRAIGTVGAMSLEDARAQAREWLKIIEVGNDPAHVAQLRSRDTMEAVCTEYLSREGAKLRTVEWRRRALARLVYPELGSRPIAEIRRSEIVRLLDRIEDRSGPVMADRILEIIRRVMNWHATRTDDFRSPIVRGMGRADRVSRDRVLNDDELCAVWRATEVPSVSPVFGAYIRFLLLTAARRSEASEMQWEEISGNDWTLPAARNKTNQDLVRPLSGAVRSILANLPRNGAFIFTRSGKRAMGGVGEMKAALCYTSRTGGWTLHDLRRTARSLMSRAGVPSDHAERCLGHVIGGVRVVYDRHTYREEMLIAYQKLASLIGQIVDPQENVVAIRGQR